MEWDIPNAPDTKFRIGSISKQFTSMLILQLIEKGELAWKKPSQTISPTTGRTREHGSPSTIS